MQKYVQINGLYALIDSFQNILGKGCEHQILDILRLVCLALVKILIYSKTL
jgi:hypothetical protein